ncbi:hypothetical protein [Faecalibacillus faecis]|uniref:hypothetical protein n=1 Tax=Faecalibacillus faecis TaxID=1982628 RepID=UPI0038660F16
MGKFQDLTGQRFNRLIAIKYLGKHKWLCKCDCGRITEVIRNNLVFSHTKSCGCLRHKYPDLKNDKTYERLYNLWRKVIRRCETKYKKKKY